jgi:PAS domain S-box-containing protein
VTAANRAACEMFGMSEEELCRVGRAGISDPNETRYAAALEERARTGKIHAELSYVRKDGTKFIGEVRSVIMGGDEPQSFVMMRDITERKRMVEDLERHRTHLAQMVEERTAELEAKSISLQELNAALKTLVQQREDDKKDMEEKFVMNVKNLVIPCVEQIKKGRLDSAQRAYLEALETHLAGITTPLLQNMRQFNLTPKEIKVAVLVRQGKSTKQIAKILGIAPGSIDVHRRNIRRKLGLTNKKANLLSLLESFG